jgi:ABC-type enterochelin transport system ATPase subunit
MLEVKDLKVAYGRVMAVKGISFKVDQGQVVTLLGTNGLARPPRSVPSRLDQARVWRDLVRGEPD